jgi:hypothetical protein
MQQLLLGMLPRVVKGNKKGPRDHIISIFFTLPRIFVPGMVWNLKPNPLSFLQSRTGTQASPTLYVRGSKYVQANRMVEFVVISLICPKRQIESQSSATAQAGCEPALQAD